MRVTGANADAVNEMVEISERYDVIEDDWGSRFGPWMREHKRTIGGKTFLFFAKFEKRERSVSGQQRECEWRVVYITVAELRPGGFTEVKRFWR